MNHSSPAATVLVVDDQEQNLQVIGTTLNIMGYDVIPALNGEDALKRVAVRIPDLILLDVLMPGMDGVEVCRRLQAEPAWAKIPVIFLSASDDKNVVVQALESGGVDYITKPFNKAELVSRVRTHIALKQARDGMQQLAEDRDELLGILTHDLKNHLAGIEMSAQLLRDRHDAPTGDARTLVDNIATTAAESLLFLRMFLANHAAGRSEVNPVPCDLDAAARAAVERARPLANAKNIVLSPELPPHPLAVFADPAALGQILDNLISNAIKFSPPGKSVGVVVARELLGAVSVTVSDEGPGFSVEDRARMFRRYGRLSARPTGNETSTGLGLYIVKRLANAMKGRVIVAPATDKGASIRVELPGQK